jgi:nitric oxide reductase subunit B
MSDMNNPHALKRDLLVSKAWLQGVVIVVLFGFFILGFLAYRTYTGEAPIPGPRG